MIIFGFATAAPPCEEPRDVDGDSFAFATLSPATVAESSLFSLDNNPSRCATCCRGMSTSGFGDAPLAGRANVAKCPVMHMRGLYVMDVAARARRTRITLMGESHDLNNMKLACPSTSTEDPAGYVT